MGMSARSRARVSEDGMDFTRTSWWFAHARNTPSSHSMGDDREEATMPNGEGAEFRWIERGAGEPLLFLHGLLGCMYHWDVSLETLAAVARPMPLALPIFDPHPTQP